MWSFICFTFKETFPWISLTFWKFIVYSLYFSEFQSLGKILVMYAEYFCDIVIKYAYKEFFFQYKGNR